MDTVGIMILFPFELLLLFMADDVDDDEQLRFTADIEPEDVPGSGLSNGSRIDDREFDDEEQFEW